MGESTTNEKFNVSITLLSTTARTIISTLLNPPKFIPTKENLQRDWVGLADILGYSSEDISLYRLSKDPTNSILQKWVTCEDSTIAKLLCCLQKMDRFDIITDIFDIIISDIAMHERGSVHNVDTSLFITNKDYECYRRGVVPITYHASILYAPEDVDFAYDIVSHLERESKMDIFVPERDLIVGTMEQAATIHVIAGRCGKLITILSPAFLESNVNHYFLSFAQSLAVEHRVRKIIPIIYKSCDIPSELKLLHKLAYKSAWPCNFFHKLESSLQKPACLEHASSKASSNSALFSNPLEPIVKQCSTSDISEIPTESTQNIGKTKKKFNVVEKIVPNVTKLMNRIGIKKQKKSKRKEPQLEAAA